MTTYTTSDQKRDNNGLVLSGKYLPQELLTKILCLLHYKSLLSCQLVCKQWEILIHTYVWRKKAEKTLGRLLLFDEEVTWDVYYLICENKPFEKKLVKAVGNPRKYVKNKHWKIITEIGNFWVCRICSTYDAKHPSLGDRVVRHCHHCRQCLHSVFDPSIMSLLKK